MLLAGSQELIGTVYGGYSGICLLASTHSCRSILVVSVQFTYSLPITATTEAIPLEVNHCYIYIYIVSSNCLWQVISSSSSAAG